LAAFFFLAFGRALRAGRRFFGLGDAAAGISIGRDIGIIGAGGGGVGGSDGSIIPGPPQPLSVRS